MLKPYSTGLGLPAGATIIDVPPILQNECSNSGGNLFAELDGRQYCCYANGGCRPVGTPLASPVYVPTGVPGTYPSGAPGYANPNLPGYTANLSTSTNFNSTTVLTVAGILAAIYFMTKKKSPA